MSLLDQASLVLVPSAIKTGEVLVQKPLPTKFSDETGNYDGNDPTTNANLTFTRNSNATRVNADGLVEKVRTNLLLQSNQFDTTWTNVNTTETGGQAGYDGTNNAWLLEKSAAGARIVQTISLTGLQTTSLYAKAGTLNWFAFTGDGSSAAYFDLQNGVVGTVSAGSTAQMVSVGGGWYRCSLSQNVTLTGLRIYPADGDLDVSGTSGSIYIQNAQLETGDIATDYIPTTSAAVSVGPTANLPRIDYTGGGCGKLLLEPQRTNLVTYSEQFDDAAWSKLNATITANATTSPDGYQNADKLVEDTSSSAHRFISSGFSTTSALSYTASIYAKQGERRYAYFRLNNSGGDLASGTIDLQTGAVTETANGTLSATVLSNGWVRITATGTSASTSAGYLELRTSNSATYSNYTGNGTSGIFAWGAQVEQSSYPSSYIGPTLGASVTRLADVVGTKTVNTLLNQTNNNTLFGEIVNKKQQAGNARFAALYNSAYNNSNRILIYSSHTGSTYEFSLQYKVSDVASVISASGLSYGQPVKWACVFNGTTISLFLNGEKAGSATVTNSDNFYYMNLTDAGDMGFEYKQLLLVPSALSDAECIELTTL